ncbi:hypothetical protein OAN307_c24260 [Octadecabacter antarcticus 307]|uniref:DUF2269 family protein n=1 Tax=Octadecabacter antarcticus 307 TaxID=391626 RepID=M9R5Z6_9RHOB|nr:DUF2269 family protein [Octadecabacter antarcticus]AGI68039.1 hypothetical protein OAN307_c24260 [Octadecabacter antarcticus 307]
MPDPYLAANFLHFLAVILTVGATVINGLIHGQAKGSTPLEASALLNAVLLINRLIMGPSLLIIPLSGYWLMTLTGYGLAETWLSISVVLSILLIAAYLFGLRLERRLHSIANRTATFQDSSLPAEFNRTFLKAAPIGFGALVMSLAALSLMIFKPF